LGRGFDTPEVQQPGALGAVGQSLRFPGVDSGLAVADPRSTGGSGTLDGETDRENRAVLGFVEEELGVDEVNVGGGHADVRPSRSSHVTPTAGDSSTSGTSPGIVQAP
jgi:hypothetical protein